MGGDGGADEATGYDGRGAEGSTGGGGGFTERPSALGVVDGGVEDGGDGGLEGGGGPGGTSVRFARGSTGDALMPGDEISVRFGARSSSIP